MGDVRRAYGYAPSRGKVYVQRPPEGWQEGDKDKCGLLRVSLYGTRDAAQNWEEEVGRALKEFGLSQGRSTPCAYRHDKKNLPVAVHGDDIFFTGTRANVEWLMGRIKSRYEIRGQVIGEAKGLAKELNIFNRSARWTAHGIEIEAEPRHAKEVIQALGLEGSNPVATPTEAG